MERLGFTVLLLALFAAIQTEARSSASPQGKINPPLKDVSSDKKFFGPPFPADYPDDKRPAINKDILNKLKGPDQPYPALQSKADFDSDYVKDENSDKGAWQAQFEYDKLRKELAQKEADEKRAASRADREGKDVDDARRADEEAGKKVTDAQKGVDDASSGDDGATTGGDDGAAPSSDELEAMKKKVAEAEAKYEQAKKNFAECERELKEAKAKLEKLKAEMAALEQKLAGESKLWAEQKTVKLNAQKAKETAALTKVGAAAQKLAAAEKIKADLEKALAKEKAEQEKALNELKKEQADVAKTKSDIDAATLRLQKLRGYDVPKKSFGKSATAGSLVFLMLMALFAW